MTLEARRPVGGGQEEVRDCPALKGGTLPHFKMHGVIRLRHLRIILGSVLEQLRVSWGNLGAVFER